MAHKRRVQTSGGKHLVFSHPKAINGVDGGQHHDILHNLSTPLQKYRSTFGDHVNVFSAGTWEAFFDIPVERKAPSSYGGSLTIGGVTLPYDADNAEALLRPAQRPFKYQYPTRGEAAKAIKRIARAFKYGRQFYIWGEAGSGKSSVIRALAADLNREFLHLEMREDLDPSTFLGQKEVVIDPESQQNITTFVPGKLLKALEGHVGRDGIRRGVVILIDDIDRAPAAYHEIFRHALDRNAKKVYVQELGHDIALHPDTQIIATANSRGRGDDRGYYSSVQMMDESLLDRFDRFIHMPMIDPKEEKEILTSKFPALYAVSQDPFDRIMHVAEEIRRLIQNGEVYFNFSHRRLEDWVESVWELVQENGMEYQRSMVQESAEDWLDRYTVTEQESVLRRITSLLG